MIELFTIGFTQKSAKKFFDLLRKNEVQEIVDTRINNTSQLSGYAKSEDLAFFAKEIGGINYSHDIDFAPTKELLAKYRKNELSWKEYEVEYLNLLDIRKIRKKVNIEEFHKHCLLCSEHSAEKCHRRLLAEYFKELNPQVKIVHLK